MNFSEFLNSRRDACRALVAELGKSFAYVTVLGSDVKSSAIRVNRNTSDIGEGGAAECGFVVKMHNGRAFFEYSLDDITGDIPALAKRISDSVNVEDSLIDKEISVDLPADEPMVRSFSRECDFDNYSDEELLAKCTEIRDAILSKSDNLLNAMVAVMPFTVSKLFISKNRELDQFYSWVNVMAVGVYRDGGKMVMAREGTYSNLMSEALAEMPSHLDRLVEKCQKLANAKPIVPGVYDVITDPSISGLIAHEAFGHGVEMDQFVKDRALAKHYVGDYVASPICNMHDGAAATFSTVYFALPTTAGCAPMKPLASARSAAEPSVTLSFSIRGIKTFPKLHLIAP